MKKGDKVEFVLYENQKATGTILKIHEKKGWEGYANVILENKNKIEIPTSFLKVVNESR